MHFLCQTNSFREQLPHKKRSLSPNSWQPSCRSGWSVFTSLLLLMSSCLRRAPWRRSVGSCSTAKGASSGEVRPRLFSVVAPGARERLTGSTRQDSQQTDKQAERCSLVCCQHVTGERPRLLACLNTNTLLNTRSDGAPRFQRETDCQSTPTGFFRSLYCRWVYYLAVLQRLWHKSNLQATVFKN